MLIRKDDVAKLKEQMKPEVKRICKNCGKEYWQEVNTNIVAGVLCELCLSDYNYRLLYDRGIK